MTLSQKIIIAASQKDGISQKEFLNMHPRAKPESVKKAFKRLRLEGKLEFAGEKRVKAWQGEVEIEGDKYRRHKRQPHARTIILRRYRVVT